MATVCGELGLTGDAVDDQRAVTKVILDLARDAAHGVARPAAPLTAYLVGVAVGRGAAHRVHGGRAGRAARAGVARIPGGTVISP